jgi:hypothetical protein
VLLIEHAGLNLMGSNLEVPRAGCPEGNLLQVLRVLVEEMGFSVVSGAGFSAATSSGFEHGVHFWGSTGMHCA